MYQNKYTNLLNLTVMKNQLKFAALLFGAFLFGNNANAQLELGAGAGANLMQGDLGGSAYNGAYRFWDINPQTIRGNVHLLARMPLNPYVKLRGNVTAAWITGSDQYAGNPELKARGVSMSGNLTEIAAMGEFRPVKNGNFYGILGFGAVFSQTTVSNSVNQTVVADPHNYWVIPVGFGTKICNVGNRGKLELEAVFHYCHSDLVDGFTSPQSRSNDTYSYLQVQYTQVLGANPRYYQQPKRNRLHHNNQICATF